METGGEYASEGDADMFSLGQLLLRVGVLDRVEIQSPGNSLVFERSGERNREGLEDLNLAVKVSVIPEGPHGATIPFFAQSAFPTGTEGFTTEGFVPTVALVEPLRRVCRVFCQFRRPSLCRGRTHMAGDA